MRDASLVVTVMIKLGMQDQLLEIRQDGYTGECRIIAQRNATSAESTTDSGVRLTRANASQSKPR